MYFRFRRSKPFYTISLFGLLLLFSFQNCSQKYSVGVSNSKGASSSTAPDTAAGSNPVQPVDPNVGGDMIVPVDVPMLVTQANPPMVVEGGNSQIEIVSSQFIKEVNYECKVKGTSQIKSSGKISLSTKKVSIPVTSDLDCRIEGIVDPASSATNTSLVSQLPIEVDCANRIKNGVSCQDFQCQSFVALNYPAQMQELSVPTRNAMGICYSLKIVNRIGNSSSSLTKINDAQVVSRDHNNGYSDPNLTRNPYVLGKAQFLFSILGPRVIKLVGGPDSLQPILVDNFIMTGVYPQSVDPSQELKKYYKVSGTSDSSVAYASQNGVGSIDFLGQYLPIIPFATGGTSTVAPLDITTSVEPNVSHALDVRALDCGGAREVSDIYILFQ